MKLIVKGVNLAITESLRGYLDEKLVRSVERILGRDAAYEPLTLECELIAPPRHHKKGRIWEAVANLKLPKKQFSQRVQAEDMYAAIDGLEDILKRELKKYKERSRSRQLRGARRAKKDMHLSRSARLWRTGRIRQEGN